VWFAPGIFVVTFDVSGCTKFQIFRGSEPRWGSLQRSPRPLAGGKGARCPDPKNPTPAFDPSGQSFVPLPVMDKISLPQKKKLDWRQCCRPTYRHLQLASKIAFQRYPYLPKFHPDGSWRRWLAMNQWHTVAVCSIRRLFWSRKISSELSFCMLASKAYVNVLLIRVCLRQALKSGCKFRWIGSTQAVVCCFVAVDMATITC